ncbi:hypothetical protein AAZV13_17G051200 [Glycine max]
MASKIFLALLITTFVVEASAGNFNQDFEITWGAGRAKILKNKTSGSGFRSRNEYLFGKFDMQIKLVPGNSAGTVTAYYLSSLGDTHDEIDFEFLGNLSGNSSSIWWFDPTKNFHTYSILWNPQSIIFSVDGTPIREFKDLESKGVSFPKNQAMRIFSSLWNLDDWATRGGLKLQCSSCVWTSSSGSSCSSNNNPSSNQAWLKQSLDATGQARIQWVQKNYMIYNYCTDTKRFPQGLHPECTIA